MEIANTQCYISSNAIRVVDIGNDIIINTVPYNKETNSPTPFNNVSLLRGWETCVGKNAIHPILYDKTVTGNTTTYQSFPDKKSVNMIIDNQNPNICYCVPTTRRRFTMTSTDNDYESNNSYSKLYKIKKDNKGNIIKSYSNYITPYSEYNNEVPYLCIYMTQTNTHIFVVERCFYTNNTSNTDVMFQTMIVKIDKDSLNVEQRTHINFTNINPSSSPTHVDGSAMYPSDGYENHNGNDIQILQETSDGFYIYTKNMCANSYITNTSSIYYNTRLLFYSFESGLFTSMTINKTSNTDLPVGLPTSDYTLSVSSPQVPISSATIPSKCIETESDYYTYLYTLKGPYTSTLATNVYNTLFYMNISKDNKMHMDIEEIALVFPEDSEITSLPSYTGMTFSSTSIATRYDWYSYETYLTNTNGVDYVHIFYKGDYNSPLTTRGIYTFRVNEEKTEATFVAFYPALGGSLIEFMPLTDDREKIVLTTNTSYHILKFDLVSESWISTYDSLTKVKSMIQTDENKLYYISEDNSIHCQDLNGAVTIDFEFEKPVYNYNNTDINSYISIWALDSEGNYCATNIKLTVIGNVVWQANGLQTLETTTSAEGPINIPFVIKGHTSINVGVDAII